MNIEVKILYKILAKSKLKNNPAGLIPGVQRWFNIRKSITKFTILKPLSFLREMANTKAETEQMQSKVKQNRK